MSVAKVIELTATPKKASRDAINQGSRRAASTLKKLEGRGSRSRRS